MIFTAEQIAQLLSGTIEGDKGASVNAFAKIEEGHENALSFLANEKYTRYIYDCQSSVVIVGNDFVAEKPISATLIKVEKPYESFALLLRKYEEFKNQKQGIEEPVFVSKTATVGEGNYIGAFTRIGNNTKIGNNVKIYPNVSIGDNVVIGDGSTLFSGVSIYDECKIGNHCTIHSGTVIGGDGFGFAPNSENNYEKIPQIGNVILEDHVELGSNCCIDRATMGSTIIRKGVKLDNLVQIAHNVEIGENTVIVSQTGVAGSTKIGKNCMIGGQVGIVGHIEIADNTKIAAQSGIGQSIKKPGTVVQGSPAFDILPYKKSYVGFKNLPDLMQKVNFLEKELDKQLNKEK
jgi:UDP-3-O-[3-hydroxymyristoyl] glucosamine N-acyltransferase